MYSDETHTAIRSSGIYYPVYLSLGNIDESVRKKDYGRMLVGFLPLVFGGNVRKTQTVAYQNMTRRFKQEALAILTQPLRDVANT